MVTDLYAHTNTEDRRQLAQKVEQDFFRSRKDNTANDKDGVSDEAAQALRLLQQNPDMAKLLIAALQRPQG